MLHGVPDHSLYERPEASLALRTLQKLSEILLHRVGIQTRGIVLHQSVQNLLQVPEVHGRRLSLSSKE